VIGPVPLVARCDITIGNHELGARGLEHWIMAAAGRYIHTSS
jgi:hypothetical protein